MNIQSKIGLACLLFFAAASEGRTWGFDKDTVYESRPGGDTLWLVNNGPDTLRLDSVFADGVDTNHWGDVQFFYQALEPTPYFRYLYSIPQGGRQREKMPGDRIPPGAIVMLWDFNVQTITISKSNSYQSYQNFDSLIVRMRFKSISQEEDTVIVKGRFSDPSSLRALIKPPHMTNKSSLLRDLRGRSIRFRKGTPHSAVSIMKSKGI